MRRVANRASCCLMAWTGVLTLKTPGWLSNSAASWARFWLLAGTQRKEGGISLTLITLSMSGSWANMVRNSWYACSLSK